MRLLTISGHDELSLVEHVGNEIEPYAILSHTWGEDKDEISFKDFVDGTYRTKEGFRKLEFCQKRTTLDNLKYFWVDTCCIDKSSSAELTEAINSMYRWYQRAARCYVYLSDVAVGGSNGTEAQSLRHWRHDFRKSRWFRRGWTLQELIAPKFVDFFDSNGVRLGDKISLIQEIHEATRLPFEALRGQVPEAFSVDVRLSWVEGRETKREEDAAYSLLGIFDIYMPLIYGEGRQRAFRRLMKELRDLTGAELPSSSPRSTMRDPQHTHNHALPVLHGTSSTFGKMPTFERYEPIDGKSQSGAVTVVPMWPGNILRTKYSGLYLKRRDSVSKAAYHGRWDEVLEHLEIATEEYGENWSNVVRLRLPHEASQLSFWTILHQAVYLRAPINIIRNLIEKGSLRTIRTAKTDEHFSHSDFTPADIARESGHAHLADILAPVIYHTVPHQKLARLQSLFYELIRVDWGDMSHLVLPDLVALTELKVPEMWFPVGEQGKNKRAVGYLYKLEDRKLVVKKLGIEKESPSVYKIE